MYGLCFTELALHIYSNTRLLITEKLKQITFLIELADYERNSTTNRNHYIYEIGNNNLQQKQSKTVVKKHLEISSKWINYKSLSLLYDVLQQDRSCITAEQQKTAKDNFTSRGWCSKNKLIITNSFLQTPDKSSLIFIYVTLMLTFIVMCHQCKVKLCMILFPYSISGNWTKGLPHQQNNSNYWPLGSSGQTRTNCCNILSQSVLACLYDLFPNSIKLLDQQRTKSVFSVM